MKTIYKYKLDVTDMQTVSMPIGSKILNLNTQQEVPCIWALIDTDNEIEDRKFSIYGTGHECRPCYEEYIGTFQIKQGFLVFHVFESFS
jgi:hypothetical protein